MKRILITGKNSYIGNHIQEWLLRSSENEYQINKISVRNKTWESEDFSAYDVLIHVAGIVHHPEIQDEELYKRINTDLPVEIAQKAKTEGVRQFIFFSTMAVYGVEKSLKGEIISKDTKPEPNGLYGKSKYLAEQELRKLSDEGFKTVIVRPPNVYGRDCPGNYISGFSSVVRKLPAIPSAYEDTRQSMLYIDNLTELVRQLIDHEAEGIYMPQDDRPISAVELMEGIAKALGIRRRRSNLLGFFMRVLCWTSIVRKAYGGVMYDQELSSIVFPHHAVSFEDAINRSIETGI